MNVFIKKKFVRHTISFVCVARLSGCCSDTGEMGGEDLGGALGKKKKTYTCKLRYIAYTSKGYAGLAKFQNPW